MVVVLLGKAVFHASVHFDVWAVIDIEIAAVRHLDPGQVVGAQGCRRRQDIVLVQ
ncbi:hypothetical protein D3C80_2138530 [compost metagenome]